MFAILVALASYGRSTDATIGMPITRTYSNEEIGVSRGASLEFDRIGRLAVISGRSYVALNDNTWIDIAEKDPDSPPLHQIVNADDQHSYYGSLASWGEAIYTDEGKILAKSLRPKDYPSWINATNFTHVVPLLSYVFFAGTNGIVCFDRVTKEQHFIELPEISKIFALQSKLYISSHSKGTLLLDQASFTTQQVDEAHVIVSVAELSNGQALVSTTGQRIMLFDGESFKEWPSTISNWRIGMISSIEALPDGGVAIAITGKGLYIFSIDGRCSLALTSVGYRRIYDLASRDPGILWLSTENSVQKLLYNNPVSVVDQRSDFVVGWPQVAQWKDQIIIVSSGRLYEMLLSEDGLSHQFKKVANPPLAGSWAIDANEKHLLVGSGTGVYARFGSSFKPFLNGFNTNRLILTEEDLCIVVGRNEIAAIHWDGENWSECSPRIAGVGFPAIVHCNRKSVWIELGLDQVARVWFRDGRLHSQRFESFPWAKPTWVNIGMLDNLVVLSGPENQRVFFDEDTEEIVERPDLLELLSSAPFPVLRVEKDGQGIIWATHAGGVMTMHPEGSDYRIDSTSLDSIRDQFPVITLTRSEGIWISTESALYHVDEIFNIAPIVPMQPFIVSVTDGKTGHELYSAAHFSSPIERLPFSQNHLVFRYFTGGYSPMQSPTYEFTMLSSSDEWIIQSADSLLTLPSLKEGDYRLKAQLKDGTRIIGKPVITEFTIDPPWYRATWAYFLYWATFILACICMVNYAMRHTKRKHAFLEALVRERTDELRSTMAKLTAEARNAATLAERNRLAGEIHDSVQQGLSGLVLQLDATLKLSNLDPDVHSRLEVARRMVSFTRQEVQQAVCDLESPLLENADLAKALRSVTNLIDSRSHKIELDVVGSTSENIDSTTKHHLLRIAQEAITNAVRHSNADNIVIKLHYSNSTVELEISDNGCGFDPEELFANGVGHFGLRGLHGRAAKIKGDLKILSKSGSGTTIRIKIPITKIDDQREPI